MGNAGEYQKSNSIIITTTYPHVEGVYMHNSGPIQAGFLVKTQSTNGREKYIDPQEG
jgi:hypothetical protein